MDQNQKDNVGYAIIIAFCAGMILVAIIMNLKPNNSSDQSPNDYDNCGYSC